MSLHWVGLPGTAGPADVRETEGLHVPLSPGSSQPDCTACLVKVVMTGLFPAGRAGWGRAGLRGVLFLALGLRPLLRNPQAVIGCVSPARSLVLSGLALGRSS